MNSYKYINGYKLKNNISRDEEDYRSTLDTNDSYHYDSYRNTMYSTESKILKNYGLNSKV